VKIRKEFEMWTNLLTNLKAKLLSGLKVTYGYYKITLAWLAVVFANPLYKKIATQIIIVTMLFVMTVLMANFLVSRFMHHPSGNVEVAQPAQIVQDEPKVAVVIKQPVKVFKHSQAIKSDLQLPKTALDNVNEHVLAASAIEPSDHPKTIITTLNAETGDSQTYVKTEPLPWVTWDNRGSVGMYGGIKNGSAIMRLQARQDFLDVKAMRVGVTANVDQPISGTGTDYFIGIGANYNW